MSDFNSCFLTSIQISQEVGEVVWYSHLIEHFPQFVVIHTVKGFGIDNKAEVYIYILEISFLFYDPVDVGFDLWFLCLFKIQLEHLEVCNDL